MGQKVQFKIKNNTTLAKNMLEVEELPSVGAKKQIRRDIEVTLSNRTRGIGIPHLYLPPEIIELTIQFGTGVSAGLASSYLYDKLKSSGVDTIEIEGKEVDVDEEEIREVVQEVLDEK